MSPRSIATFEDRVSVPALQAEIHQKTGGRVRNLRVYRTEEGLVLTGLSGTFYAKQLAQHAALELEPQVRLVNDITVGEPD